MYFYYFIDELKKQNAEQYFRDWLFGNSLQNGYEIEKEFEGLFGNLRSIISDNRNLVDTYIARNNSNQYYPGVVVCDKKDMRTYEFKDKKSFCELLVLIFCGILTLRYNSNSNEYFVSNNMVKRNIENEKNWWSGGDYQINHTYEYKKGELIEKDLKIFQFKTDYNELTIKDVLGILN